MPVNIDGNTYYRTAEACRMIGISRATLFRWFSEKIIEDTAHRDRKNWRLFSRQDIAMIEVVAHKIK